LRNTGKKWSLSPGLARAPSKILPLTAPASTAKTPTSSPRPPRPMRMIPPVALRDATASERQVFARLAELSFDDDWRCLHSLNLSEHEYKRMGELDFVVVSPLGILVLEVKGGRVSRDESGIWTYSTRHHSRTDSEGPFRQAESGMHSLRHRLHEELGGALSRGTAFGYGVVFPFCEFRERSVEWSAEMILDQSDFRRPDGVKRYLASLYSYWRAKESVPTRLVSSSIRTITNVLRPTFDRVPSLRWRCDQILEAMEELTNEQYHLLDQAEEHPRLLFQGGAGTGKTFLAAEVARRHAKQGQRVLLGCSSSILAGFIASRLEVDNVDVRALSGADLDVNDQYDVLVLDEGQDLLNFSILDRLDRVLSGGLAHGTWRVFYDANHQAGLLGAYEPGALELLTSYGGIRLRLLRNCRNTHDIVLQTKLVTGADLGTPSAGRGPGVDYLYCANKDEARATIEQRVARLIGDAVEPGEISILSTKPLALSCLSDVQKISGCQLVAIDPRVSAVWPVKDLTFATVADFKGLENQFVLLIDVDRIDEEKGDFNLLYVAMSRARTGLYIIADQRLKRPFAEIQQRHLSHALNDATPN
jgi:hypothetical protein